MEEHEDNEITLQDEQHDDDHRQQHQQQRDLMDTGNKVRRIFVTDTLRRRRVFYIDIIPLRIDHLLLLLHKKSV